MSTKSGHRGIAIIPAMVTLAVLVIIASSYLLMVSREHRMTYKSFQSLQALNLAEAGIERTIWEMNYASTPWTGWTVVGDTYTKDFNDFQNSSGKVIGDFSAEIDMSNPDAPQIESTGYVPDRTSAGAEKTVQVMLEKLTLSDNINEAVISGGSVAVSGNAEIVNTEGDAIQYPGPPSYTYTVGGSATVTPAAPAIDDFPTFEEVFGLSQAQMASIASATYTNPATNVPLTPTGITWINGDAKFTQSGWDGEGILIVTGNLEIGGGDFDGVIYVMGGLSINGNPEIEGAVLVKTSLTADVTYVGGNPTVEYNSTTINNMANSALPWRIESMSWQEQ